jgi:Sec-independent protein secretion pathway component TatC
MFMAFGITFQVPVLLLVRMDFVTVEKLREARPYAVVGAFVIGAIFTPPDVVRNSCWRCRCGCCMRQGSWWRVG